MRTCRVVGPGRAGQSFTRALRAAGWVVPEPLGRDADLSTAAEGADLLILAVPDAAVAAVAAAVPPRDSVVVAHCAGSLGLDVLAPHARTASIHPLVSLPDGETGARLLGGAWFAVAGDPLAAKVVADLGGQSFEVRDEHRAGYHAAAAVAANHVVALLGQVERIAAEAGVPLAAYLDLARGAIESAAVLGPAAALTGPVARGDWATVERHLAALPAGEIEGYLAGARLAAVLAGRDAHDVPAEAGGEVPCS